MDGFDINDLITPYIQKLLDGNSDIVEQTDILMKLLDYDKNYSENAASIGHKWSTATGKTYNVSVFYPIQSDIKAIKEYAEGTGSIKKVKNLINDLCTALMNGDNNYRDIIDNSDKDFSPIQDLSDADFTFLPILNGQAQKADDHRRSLDEILKYKDLVKK